MKKFIPIIVVSLMSLAVGLIFYFRPRPTIPQEIQLSVDNVVESFDPALAYSDDAFHVMSQVLEAPYQYHYLKRPYEIIPLIADGLPEVADEGKTYTFRLKTQLLFHSHPAFEGNRRELQPEDFILALKRIAFLPLKSPFSSFFQDTLVGFKEFSEQVGQDWKKLRDTPLTGVQISGRTITLKLLRQEPNLIYYLAMPALAPLPWEVLEYHQNDLSDTLVGTGPYQYIGYVKNRYHLRSFSNYREEFYPTSGDRYANTQNLLKSSREKIPFIQEVNFHVIPDEEARWEAFIEGKIDLLSVPRSMLPRLFGDGGKLRKELEQRGVQVKHFPVQALRWLAFNMRDPVWGKNLLLRQALAHAIDIDAYIELLSQKTNLKAHSLMVPGLLGYDPSSSLPFHYDLAKAKELLALAGFPEGKGLAPLVYSTRGNQEASKLEAQFIAGQLKKVGIEMQTQVLTFKEFLTEGRAGRLQFFTDNWLFDYPDGENILQLLVSTNAPGINKAGYTDAEIDKWYQQLRITTDAQEKIHLMNQIEHRVLEQLPWVPLMYESSYVLLSPHVKNYRKSSVARNYVKYLKLSAEKVANE